MSATESSNTMVSSPAAVTAPPVPRTVTSILRRRLLDLVVISWVTAVGLTTGRQLIDWWREDPGTVPQPVRDVGEDWYRRPVELSVGQRGVPLHRSPFVGTRTEVERQLMQLVQARLKDTPVPGGSPDEAEQAFLEKLEAELPIATDHGRGTLYRWPAPWPGVIGTMEVSGTERIVAHGFAVPSGQDKWTVFVLSAQAHRGSSDTTTSLPPGALPLMSWTDEAGRRVATFRGTGTLTEWVAFWEQEHREEARTVREVGIDSATMQFRSQEFVTDIQLQRTEEGKLTGVCWTIPLAPKDTLQSLPTDTDRNSPEPK